ncbi:unnamed protein product [Dracunculus medinensis]|uniref:START domain-containing protein n=1 Tax=Dracunculus medinensis TaxID=318479 RepID=A0A0N4U0Q7_DRAME|nr:unnamed protein product [Dracunculus medinensis]
MSLYDQVRQGFAKVIQIASDNTIYDSFPECSFLSTTNVISIKPANQEQIDIFCRKLGFHGVEEFNIKFHLRDETGRKRIVIEADLVSVHPTQIFFFFGRGFVINKTDGSHIMEIKLPKNSPDTIGKIVHPSQATLYKIFKKNDGDSPVSYEVRKIDDNKPSIIIEKASVSIYSIAKMIGILDAESVYQFRSSNRIIIGHLRPKLSFSGKTMIIKFARTQPDPQLRAAVIGASLLLTLIDVHPILKQAWEKTIELARFDF